MSSADDVVRGVLTELSRELHIANGSLPAFDFELRMRAMKGVVRIGVVDPDADVGALHDAFAVSWAAAECVIAPQEVLWCRLRVFLSSTTREVIAAESVGPYTNTAILVSLGLEMLRQEKALRAPMWITEANWIDRVFKLFQRFFRDFSERKYIRKVVFFSFM